MSRKGTETGTKKQPGNDDTEQTKPKKKPRTRYTKDMVSFVQEYAPGHSTKEISDAFLQKFGKKISTKQITDIKRHNKIRSNIPAGRPSELYPDEVKQFIYDNSYGVPPKIMTEMVNTRFHANYARSQIIGFYNRHNIDYGVYEYYIVKKDPSTGKLKAYGYKSEEGWIVSTNMVIRRSDGHLWRKVCGCPEKWALVCNEIWTHYNGKIPDGKNVVMVDGDKLNVDIDNLALADI